MTILQIQPARGVIAWFKHHNPSGYAYDVLLWAVVNDGRIVGVVLIDGRMTICDEQEDFIRYEQRGGIL